MTERKKGLLTAVRLFLAMLLAVPQGLTVIAEGPEETEGTVPEVFEVLEEPEEHPEEDPAAKEEPAPEEEKEVTPEDSGQEDPSVIQESEELGTGEEEKTEEAKIVLSASQAELNVGETFSFTAELVGIEEGTAILWTSSDPEIITVDENGTVTAIAAGSASV